MKKYSISVKMPSRNGAMSQQVIGGHEAEDADALCAVLNDRDFIVVEQFFRGQDGALVPSGPVILNRRVIGKVREYQGRPAHGED